MAITIYSNLNCNALNKKSILYKKTEVFTSNLSYLKYKIITIYYILQYIFRGNKKYKYYLLF